MTRRMVVATIVVAATLVGAGCSDGDDAPAPSTTTLAGSQGADFEGTGLPRPEVTANDVVQFCADVDDYLATSERPPDELLRLGLRSSDLQFGQAALDAAAKRQLQDCMNRLAAPPADG